MEIGRLSKRESEESSANSVGLEQQTVESKVQGEDRFIYFVFIILLLCGIVYILRASSLF